MCICTPSRRTPICPQCPNEHKEGQRNGLLSNINTAKVVVSIGEDYFKEKVGEG